MLPGQSYRIMHSKAFCEIVRAGRLFVVAMTSMKCGASSGMSSPRSLKSGSSMLTTISRMLF
jgi:hypothetical protein